MASSDSDVSKILGPDSSAASSKPSRRRRSKQAKPAVEVADSASATTGEVVIDGKLSEEDGEVQLSEEQLKNPYIEILQK